MVSGGPSYWTIPAVPATTPPLGKRSGFTPDGAGGVGGGCRRRDSFNHSDQGVQYASTASVARLEAASAPVSMAAVGNPYEKAKAERFGGTLKHEEV